MWLIEYTRHAVAVAEESDENRGTLIGTIWPE